MIRCELYGLLLLCKQVWSENGAGGYQEHFSFTHDAAIVGLTVHPSGHYFVTATANAQWQLFDAVHKSLLAVVTASDSSTVFTSCAFHPDGLILGTGTTSGTLKVWDVREQKLVKDLPGHTGSIHSVVFSENGYLAASGAANGEIKIWDLRKLTSVKSLEGIFLILLL
jgi:pre-mRNA-processing factor 19